MRKRDRLDAALGKGQTSDPALANMVRAAQQLNVLSAVPPLSEAERGAARRAFMAEANRLPAREISSSPNPAQPLKRRAFSPALALAGALVVFLLVLGFGSHIPAVQASLPGDSLYSYKILSENLTCRFTFDRSERVDLWIDLVAVRNAELSELAARGEAPPDQTVTRLEQHLAAALVEASQLPDDELQSALKQIVLVSLTTQEVIEQVNAQIQADATLEEVAAVACTAQALAEQGLRDPQAFRMSVSVSPSLRLTPTSTMRVVYPPLEPTPLIFKPTATQNMFVPPVMSPTPLLPSATAGASTTPPPPAIPPATDLPPVLPSPTPIVAPTQAPTPTPTQAGFPTPTPTPLIMHEGGEGP